jgi:hypothetical protein
VILEFGLESIDLVTGDQLNHEVFSGGKTVEKHLATLAEFVQKKAIQRRENFFHNGNSWADTHSLPAGSINQSLSVLLG